MRLPWELLMVELNLDLDIRQKDSAEYRKDSNSKADAVETVAQGDQPECHYNDHTYYKTHQSTERHSDYSMMEELVKSCWHEANQQGQEAGPENQC